MDGRIACCRYQPSLDDLLADDIMRFVLRSAGLDASAFREMMAAAARRIAALGLPEVEPTAKEAG